MPTGGAPPGLVTVKFRGCRRCHCTLPQNRKPSGGQRVVPLPTEGLLVVRAPAGPLNNGRSAQLTDLQVASSAEARTLAN